MPISNLQRSTVANGASATINASATFAVFTVSGATNGGSFDSLLCGSDSATLVTGIAHSGGNPDPTTAVFWLASPPTGSQTVTVSGTSFAGTPDVRITVYSLSGVNSTPVVDSVTQQNSGTTSQPPSLSTGSSGFAVWAVATETAGAISADSGLTEEDELLQTSARNASYYLATDGATVQPTFSATNGTWSITGVSFAESGASDTTAPVLTSPTAGSITSTSVTPSVTTDEANGTAYARVYANGATPTAAQVVSGTGVTPVASASSVSVGSTGPISFGPITGLTAGTDYELFFAHEDAAGNVSNASSVGFTTTALTRTVALTSANNTEFRDRFGVVQANLEIDWEYYDQESSTEGASTDSGTVTLNGSGETTLTLTNSTAADNDPGTLVVFATANSAIRGVYRVIVSVS